MKKMIVPSVFLFSLLVSMGYSNRVSKPATVRANSQTDTVLPGKKVMVKFFSASHAGN